MFRVEMSGERLNLFLNNRLAVSHTPDEPFVHAGRSRRAAEQSAGRFALPRSRYDAGRQTIRFWGGGGLSVTFAITENDGNLVLSVQRASAGIDRLDLDFPARPAEKVYGGGTRYDTVEINGKRVSLRVTDTGGEDNAPKRRAGFVNPFPVPVFITQTAAFVYSAAASGMDLRNSARHRLEFSELPQTVTVGCAENVPELMKKMTKVVGRQAMLPTWVHEGAIVEISGGIQPMIEKLEKIVGSDASPAALWIRDWTGRRDGGEVFFDWTLNREMYPRLDKLIPELTNRNVRVLSYVNPHLAIEGRLFAEASAKRFLVRKPEGGNYISDMGGFMAGHVDLTNPDACLWFKEIIKLNILGAGFSGYMADMGAFLPEDAVLKSGEPAAKARPRWSHMWARLNRQVLREAGRGQDALFFTRTGCAGSPSQTMLSTVGEINPSWGERDGLPSALTAALSLSLSGMGLSVSEIGGSNPGAKGAGKELFLRWLEWSAFTPVMLLPEPRNGGRGIDGDDETLKLFSRMVNVRKMLAPYLRTCVKDNAADGMPVMRPMFLAFPGEKQMSSMRDQYMLGEEMLVAPVLKRAARERRLVLPEGYWVHLWTGRQYTGGETNVSAPIGKPPVFYRPAGKYAPEFDKFLEKFAEF